MTPHKDERLEGWRGLIDRSLDTAIVPGFGRLGPLLRRRLSDWEAALAAAGRKIVITGATSGLGLASAQQLAAAGASLVLVGRSEQKLAEAHKLVSSYAEGGEVETMHCDMGDLDQVRTLASQLNAAGPLDVLIHNAGALDHAADLYEAFLNSEPSHFKALNALGVLRGQLNQPELGRQTLKKARFGRAHV